MGETRQRAQLDPSPYKTTTAATQKNPPLLQLVKLTTSELQLPAQVAGIVHAVRAVTLRQLTGTQE